MKKNYRKKKKILEKFNTYTLIHIKKVYKDNDNVNFIISDIIITLTLEI